MNNLTIQDVLVYYDGPQVFSATDGTKSYVCIHVEEELYLCVPVTQESLSLYMANKINELALFSATSVYPVAEMNDDGLSIVKMFTYEQIPPEWFPIA